jgi:hypothetical protein
MAAYGKERGVKRGADPLKNLLKIFSFPSGKRIKGIG